MNEQKIEELKNALREILQMIAARNQPMTPQLKDALAQLVEHVGNRIQQLRAQESPAEGLQPQTQVPQLQPGPYPSSNVNSFKYEPSNGTLFVKFHGKDSANSGPIYQYGNVPKFVYDVFSKGRVAPKTSGQNKYHRWIKGVTPSLGASLYALIRNGGYSYSRIS